MAKFRPLKASQYQDKNDPVRLIADRGIRPVRDALVAALKHLRAALPKEQMAALISAGDYQGAARAIDMGRFQDALKAPFGRIVDTYRASGDRVAEIITGQLKRVRKAPGGIYGFDLYTGDVVEQLAEYQLALIEGLSEDAQDIVLQTIVESASAGIEADLIVDQIRDVIGLTERQALAVANLRLGLEAGSRDVLGRALLDTADKGIIRTAFDSGIALVEEKINEIVTRYAENSLTYRAGMIAQTESVRASNLGLQAAYMQAIDRGVFPADAVRKFWLTALDEKVCPICRPIPLDHPDGISIDDAFDVRDGSTISYPPVHPNCRCSIKVITDLDQLDAGRPSATVGVMA